MPIAALVGFVLVLWGRVSGRREDIQAGRIQPHTWTGSRLSMYRTSGGTDRRMGR